MCLLRLPIELCLLNYQPPGLHFRRSGRWAQIFGAVFRLLNCLNRRIRPLCAVANCERTRSEGHADLRGDGEAGVDVDAVAVAVVVVFADEVEAVEHVAGGEFGFELFEERALEAGEDGLVVGEEPLVVSLAVVEEPGAVAVFVGEVGGPESRRTARCRGR